MGINDIIRSAVNNVQRNQNEFDVEQWAKEKNKQREWAYQTQDEMAEKISVDSEKYKTTADMNEAIIVVEKGSAGQLAVEAGE